MEALGLGWLAKLGEGGDGWIVAGLLVLVLVWLTKKYLACYDQGRADAIKIAIALEQANKAMADSNEVERQRIEADKISSAVLQAVIKQIDVSDERLRKQIEVSDDRAKDRATNIKGDIESVIARVESLLHRWPSVNNRDQRGRSHGG